jgi:hypothetical protein
LIAIADDAPAKRYRIDRNKEDNGKFGDDEFNDRELKME